MNKIIMMARPRYPFLEELVLHVEQKLKRCELCGLKSRMCWIQCTSDHQFCCECLDANWILEDFLCPLCSEDCSAYFANYDNYNTDRMWSNYRFLVLKEENEALKRKVRALEYKNAMQNKRFKCTFK